MSFSTFFAGGLKCLKENDPEDFDNSCDGAQVPGSTPNDRAVLHREGACPDGTLSCTYRVTWIGYSGADRVRQAMTIASASTTTSR